MTTRPYHSPQGFRRYIQMSSARLFVMVEGRRNDEFFYGEICKSVCEPVSLSYEIVQGDRISQSGGKQNLIALHEYLRSEDCLTDASRDLPSWCFFFLDKDVDDVLKRLIVSPHVVYTPFYGIENVLFVNGDIVRAASAASSLDSRRIQVRIVNAEAWRKAKADQWREFITLCLFSHKYNVDCACRFGRNSLPVDEGFDAPGNEPQIGAMKAELQRRSGLAPGSFARKYGACARLVGRIFRTGNQEMLFNGKWYLGLLLSEVEQAAAGQRYNAHALSNGITAALCATLDFSAGWAYHFKGPLRRILGLDVDVNRNNR